MDGTITVCNVLKVHGDNAEEIVNSLTSEAQDKYGGFDFDKILPHPHALDYIKEQDGAQFSCIAYVNSLNRRSRKFRHYYGLLKMPAHGTLGMIPQFTWELKRIKNIIENGEPVPEGIVPDLEMGRYALDMQEIYGCRDIEVWCKLNWGVTHNIENSAIRGNTVYFDTGGGDVKELVRTLSIMHPECLFEYAYTCDTGNEVLFGKSFFLNGEESDSEEKEYIDK